MRLKHLSGPPLWISLATVVGILILLAAFWLTSDSPADWLAGTLVNVGASVVLIVPIYLLTKRLDERIGQFSSETQASVRALADRVETFEQDVERRIEDIAGAVEERLEQERQADAAAFEALRENPSRRVVLEALWRAKDLQLISTKRGPRVRISPTWHIFVRFNLQPNPFPGESVISFTVEDYHGNALKVVPWPEVEDTATTLTKLARSIEANIGEAPNITSVFHGLFEIIRVAQSDVARRPIWQLCPPQWVIAETGIVTYGSARVYDISMHQLANDKSLSNHMHRKEWIIADSFDEAAALAIELRKKTEEELRNRLPF